MIDQPSHTVEPQFLGEIDRRRLEDQAAAAKALEMTDAEMKAAGIDGGAAKALKRDVRERTGRRKPSEDEIAQAVASEPETTREAAKAELSQAEEA